MSFKFRVIRRKCCSRPCRGQKWGINLEEEIAETMGSTEMRTKPSLVVGWIGVKLRRVWNCNGHRKKVIAREGFTPMSESVWMKTEYMQWIVVTAFPPMEAERR
nr:hypothetical protein CFP56_52000 [Quercus suber]